MKKDITNKMEMCWMSENLLGSCQSIDEDKLTNDWYNRFMKLMTEVINETANFSRYN